MAANERKILRCAVYTRKSSEHGLEQDFNSLDAQREAGEAYIQSQAHEGWRLIARPRARREITVPGTGSATRRIDQALILSIAKFYTPGGKAIQDNPITPNVVVADSRDADFGFVDEDNQDQQPPQPKAKPDAPKTDDQLKKGIEVLKAREQRAQAAGASK